MRMKRSWFPIIPVVVLCVFMLANGGCDWFATTEPVSRSGVKIANVSVRTDEQGHTSEQGNVIERLNRDNESGSIKHLYVISAYSGQVLIYSTVKGKVTSGGKRLSPTTAGGCSGCAIPFILNGATYYTTEVAQDDGTYGTSLPYLFWFDTRGVYHQHYVEGGQILHISDQPIAVKSIVINMEISEAPKKDQ